jgi:hypothetical protein
MAMIFEFEEMEDAEAFVSAVKTRWDLGGKVFDDGDEANAEAGFPWVLYPPVAVINRVWAHNDDEAIEIKRRFGLTNDEIAGWRKRFPSPPDQKAWALASAAICLAELKVEELAEEFGGDFVGT